MPFFIISKAFEVNRRYTYEVCGGGKYPFGLGMREKQRVKDAHPLTIFFLK